MPADNRIPWRDESDGEVHDELDDLIKGGAHCGWRR